MSYSLASKVDRRRMIVADETNEDGHSPSSTKAEVRRHDFLASIHDLTFFSYTSSMSRSLVCALDRLVDKNEPITVTNVFKAYAEVINFVSAAEVDDAVWAFGHALDKYPRPPRDTIRRRRYLQEPEKVHRYLLEVEQLRRDWWTARLGSAKCTCGRCVCPGDDSKYAYDEDATEMSRKQQKERRVKRAWSS